MHARYINDNKMYALNCTEYIICIGFMLNKNAVNNPKFLSFVISFVILYVNNIPSSPINKLSILKKYIES